MTYEEMAKLMPGADKAQIQAAVDAVNAAQTAAVEKETNGLLENKTKLLSQMDKLKKNQAPEGYDAEGYTKFVTESEELEKKQKELADQELEGKGQWEALKLQLNQTHETNFNTFKTEAETTISGLQKALDKELVENNLIKAIESEKGNSLFLLPHMNGQVKTVKGEDGQYSVQVVDEKGAQRFQDDMTTPFAVKDLVAEFKANDTYSLAFPDLNSGSGNDVNTGGKGGNGANPWKADTKNITEQARITKENPTLAAQFKKAAGVE